jgi:hypothetical protein
MLISVVSGAVVLAVSVSVSAAVVSAGVSESAQAMIGMIIRIASSRAKDRLYFFIFYSF